MQLRGDNVETKVCGHCKIEKDIDSFGKDKGEKDNKCRTCKVCMNEQGKRYREKNPGKAKESSRIYYANNKEKESQRKKEFRKIHYEKLNESSRKYRAENKEKIAEYGKKHYKENIDIIKEKAIKYRIKNSEKIKQRNKIYRLANQERSNVLTQQYRARKSKLPSTLTVDQWEMIKQHFDNKCCYCGKEKPLAREHFIPITKEGGFTLNNIIPSCKSCNSSKFNRTFEEWYKNYRFYSKKREKAILKFLGYTEETQQLKII